MKHYLYRHVRLDTNEPFYIGVGTKKSIKTEFLTSSSEYKRAYSKYTRSNLWKNITSKTDYEVEILLESDDYEFIKQKEIEFIALYGRRDLNKGTLVNHTDGGDGALGTIISEETRNKMSEARSGKNNAFYGKTHSDETKKIISENSKGRIPKNKGKKSEISGESHPQYGLPLSEERKNNIRKANTGKIRTQEVKNSMSGKVVDTTTNEIIGSPKQIAELHGWLYRDFLAKLNGKKINDTKYYLIKK